MAFINDQNLTLNQVDLIFREIAANHAQINGYGNGIQSDINTNTVLHYPLMWTALQPFNLQYRTAIYNYQVLVLDLVDLNHKNLLEVQSDTFQICIDIIVLLRDFYGLVIEYDIQNEPVIDSKPDMLAGWLMDLHVEIPLTLGYCDVPQRILNPSFNDLLIVNGTYINVITGMRLNVGPQISGNDFINIDGSFFEDIDGSIVNYQ